MKPVVKTSLRRPRLLVLASTYPRWAGDHEPGFVHELSRRLVGHYDVTVLCPHSSNALMTERMDGVDVIRYRYAPGCWETLVNDGGIVTNLRRARWKILLVPTFVVSQAWAALRLLQRMRFDVIHAHWLLPQGLIAAALQFLTSRKTAYVVTSHGADLYALNGGLMDALKRFVLRRSAAATVVSSAMRNAIEAIGADVSKVLVQPMGVDLSNRFTPDPHAMRSRDEILFVGRLVEKKGLRHLIDALPTIIASRSSAFLTIAGFGPEEAERREQVTRMGLQAHVRFLGAVTQEELPHLYRRAAVFVAPFVEASSGDREGLGLVSIEAVGCGCTVVVSDFPAVHQVFPDGAGARFVPPGDAVALAKAVLSVLQDATPIPDEELQRLRNAFDWQSRSAQYSAILSSAIG